MLTLLQSPLALVARLLVALLFLPEGLGKVAEFHETASYIAATGLPFPEMGVVIAIAVEVGGSLALIVGFQVRRAALLMALFTVATGFIFHNYWAVPSEQATLQHIMFFKNMAIAGGLLMMAAFGAGPWSLDAKLRAQVR